MPEKQSLAGSPHFRRALVSVCAVALIVMVGALLHTDLTPEDTRHSHFVAALWPPGREPGRSLNFLREPAILYRDPSRPLTWHVCTATRCGRYFEDEHDVENSK